MNITLIQESVKEDDVSALNALVERLQKPASEDENMKELLVSYFLKQHHINGTSLKVCDGREYQSSPNVKRQRQREANPP